MLSPFTKLPLIHTAPADGLAVKLTTTEGS